MGVEKKWITLIGLIVLQFPYFAFTQIKSSCLLRASAHYGVILQHRNSMGHLINGHISGAELNIAFPSYGKNLYEIENNQPEKGVGIFWLDLANREQLGQLIAFAPFLEIPLNEQQGFWTQHLRLGLGIGYATRKFDPIENHKNNVISTSFNGFVNFKFLFKHIISPKFRLDYGLSLMHASNGKFKVPNLGINVGTFNLAVVFMNKQNNNPISDPIRILIDSSTQRKSKYELLFGAALGITTIYPVGSQKFLAQSYSAAIFYNKRNTHKWGMGSDVFYNPANKINAFQEDSLTLSSFQNIQIGFKGSWAYNIGRISLPIEMGVYVHTGYKGDGVFYHRIGVRYYFKNNLVASFTLKAHWARADYFEYGFAYRLPLNVKN